MRLYNVCIRNEATKIDRSRSPFYSTHVHHQIEGMNKRKIVIYIHKYTGLDHPFIQHMSISKLKK